ncbi:MAG TPA: SagB family peptide dehydrogenase [Thermoanaerobaculia bacterium]|nr:SagB family peptide dehydrogenase [Thermoanaerobaculia bacterium]
MAEGCRWLAPETLDTPRGPLTFPNPSGRAIQHLLEEGATEERLAAAAAEEGGYPAVRRLYLLLFTLHERLLLCRTVALRPAGLLSSVPLSPSCRFSAGRVDAEARHALSRFALLRPLAGRLVLESPLALARVTLGGPEAVLLVSELVCPRYASELSAALGLSADAILSALDLLAHASLLADADESSPALAAWEFHDALFHTRSRLGRYDSGFGGTFPGRGRFAPLPALRPAGDGETINLLRPDLACLAAGDPSFTRVLEERRSRRAFGELPISCEQLGELLYRVARVTGTSDTGECGVARRVYPAGGAIYELEVYLAVGACRGLDPGLYHYRPLAHELERVSGSLTELAVLLEGACDACQATGPVQVLVLLAARFPRIFYKYESTAYATILKDTGVFMQTLYLVTTAMGLAACALGGGDSDQFARAAGTDPWTEATVGEMVIGSLG